MESSPFVLQTGSVNPVPLMETRNPGSSQQQPPFRPVDASGSHFHHVGGTHVKAADPCSPNLAGRTRSVEGVSEQKSVGKFVKPILHLLCLRCQGQACLIIPPKRTLNSMSQVSR